MATKPYHERMRSKLLLEFKLDGADVRKCFGSKPQGNDSAFYQGCHDCENADACYEATQKVHAAIPDSYWKKANERYTVEKDERGPYVRDTRAGFKYTMSAAAIVKILNKYEESKCSK